jgi:curved DNA-binding protein
MDYYKTLGVERNSSPDEIKKAYRKMAAKHHPDRGGNKEDFQKVEEAYRHLSDPHLKQQHDNPHSFGGGHNPFGDGFNFNFGGGNPFDDLFAQFRHQQRQRVYTVVLNVTLEQIAKGEVIPVQFGTHGGSKTFQISIPQGIEDGQQVRYEGLMDDGVVQIQFRQVPHAEFERHGLDLHTSKKISVFDFITGTTVRIKTIYGDELDMMIHAGTAPGSTMRVAGKGLRNKFTQGNHYVLLQAEIPDTISPELMALIRAEQTKKDQNDQ